MGCCVLAGDDDVHVCRCQVTRPDQALLVVVALGDSSQCAGHTHTVGAHGHGLQLAVLVQNLQAQCLSVLAAQGEDVAHLDTAGCHQLAGAVRCRVAFAHLARLDHAVGGEVAAEDQVRHVLALFVCAGHPAGTAHHTGVNEEGNAGCGSYRILVLGVCAEQGCVQAQAGANVALDQLRVCLQVLFAGCLDLDLAADAQQGADVDLNAAQVHGTVAGNAHGEDLTLAGGGDDGAQEALEGLRSFQGAAGNLGVQFVHALHQGLNGGGVGGVHKDCRRGVLGDFDFLGNHGGDGLNVCRVAARGTHEGVLTDGGRVQELFTAGAAHRAGLCGHNDNLQAQALKDALVGGTVSHVRLVQALVVNVEGVGVLHDELAAAQQTRAGARLVAVLGLNLVQVNRKVLVGGVQVLDQQSEHFLVGGCQQHVGTLTVLETEEVVAVLIPAVSCLVGFAGQQCGEVNFLRANGIHLFTDDVLDLAQYLQAQGQPGVHAGGCAADVTGADQQLVAGDLSVYGVLAQSAHEEVGKAKYHDSP